MKEKTLSNKTRRRVFQAILDAGPTGVSDEQIERATGLRGNTVRPRRSELAKAGLIAPRRCKRSNERGIPVKVWVARRGVKLASSMGSPREPRPAASPQSATRTDATRGKDDCCCDRCGHQQYTFYAARGGQWLGQQCARCGRFIRFINNDSQ